MRIPLLAVALLSTIAAAPAHADTFYTYSGTVLLNGSYLVGPNPYLATPHLYVNLPVAATVVIRDAVIDINGVSQDTLVLESVDVDYPDQHFDKYVVDEYLNFENCALNPDDCDEVYLSNYLDYNPVIPAPYVTVYGGRDGSNFDDATQTFTSWYESYNGQLDLVTGTTPEPSTFALLGTGLLGITGVIRKRLA